MSFLSRVGNLSKYDGNQKLNDKGSYTLLFDKIQKDLIKESDDGTKRDLVNVEFETLVDRILHILDETIDKIQIALIIPQLLTNTTTTKDELLSKCLTTVQRHRLMNYCSKYLQESESSKFDIEKSVFVIDHQLVKAVELIHDIPKIRDRMPELIERLPPLSQQFLQCIKDLKYIAETRLKTTANMEMAKDKVLHKVYHDNEKTKQEINALTTQIHEKEVALQFRISEKNALIKKYKMDLADRKWKSSVLIQKEISTANKRMMNLCTASEEEQNKLKEQAVRVKAEYEKLLSQNMETDKRLREKKARILIQVQAWIKKYDTDIGERTKEVERLTLELQQQTDMLNEFMEEFDRQAVDYNKILLLKEAEEKEIQQEKMMLFMMNRAARTIQAAWRQFLLKKKKKGKGKGKGKKAKK